MTEALDPRLSIHSAIAVGAEAAANVDHNERVGCSCIASAAEAVETRTKSLSAEALSADLSLSPRGLSFHEVELMALREDEWEDSDDEPLPVRDPKTGNLIAGTYETAAAVHVAAVPKLTIPPKKTLSLSPSALEVPHEPFCRIMADLPMDSLSKTLVSSIFASMTPEGRIAVLEHFPSASPVTVLDAIPPATLYMSIVRTAVCQNWIQPCDEGKNGAFLVFADPSCRGLVLAIFKPRENEIGTELSKAKHGRFICSKEGILPGESALLELLAYYLDQKFGGRFHVPPTWFAEVAAANLSYRRNRCVKKEGAFQLFLSDCKTFDQITGEEASSLSRQQVQTIATWDILTFNADRNAQNLLIRRGPDGRVQLIPVDHGCILPTEAQSGGEFCWLDLPQVQEPICPELDEFIDGLTSAPLRTCIEELRAIGVHPMQIKHLEEKILVHEVVIAMLKYGKNQGLSLYEIALFCTGPVPLIARLMQVSLDPRTDHSIPAECIFSVIERFFSIYKEKKMILLTSDPSLSAENLIRTASQKALEAISLK
jgi:hypothetical protein